MSTGRPFSEELSIDGEVIEALRRHGERDMEFSSKARKIFEEVGE